MKRLSALCLAAVLFLCSCTPASNVGTSPAAGHESKAQAVIVGKWIDVQTEQIIEYTADGFFYEYNNESFRSDKTRYITEDGKIYYYLDGDEPDMEMGIEYEMRDGHLFIAKVLEYRPMDLKTSIEEME